MKYKIWIFNVTIVLVACMPALAQDKVREKFVFTPQWSAQAQFAGYYVAKEKGFYDNVGLDVEIVHPSVTQPAIDRVRRGESQATTLQLCEAMDVLDDGIPLVNILQTSMNNGMVIISRWGKNPLTQKGERVGVWSAGFGQLARCMSMKDNLNYEWIRFSTNITLFLTGAIDATLGMSYNEYYQILQAGFPLTDEEVYRFCDHGYNVQEDGVYMQRAYYLSHRDQARKFSEASRKGWEWAVNHFDETLDIVMKYVTKEHIATNRVLQKLMLEETLRLQLDRESGKREFRLRPDMVKLASDLMFEYGMIHQPLSYEDLVGDN
ncbi:MAG: ABC transporter substrate-binding protein [Bacteroidaceae bacterium]|nr:ABC transporter substrate-binding protein [Bacteroidaceae bacterium]